MRLIVRILLFGAALGLAGLSVYMIGFGVMTAGTASPDTPALAIGPIYAIATYRVAMGIAALVAAGLCAGGGVLAGRQAQGAA